MTTISMAALLPMAARCGDRSSCGLTGPDGPDGFDDNGGTSGSDDEGATTGSDDSGNIC